MITAERLREVLNYDPETGAFRWLIQPSKRMLVGHIAGHVNPNRGHIWIGIDRRLYLAHRLAFLWMNGQWPAKCVDHIDRNRANNAWRNLREATISQNGANAMARPNTRSGLKGVSTERNGRWNAKITVKGRRHRIGTFDTKEEAHAAYIAAAVRHFGEFASSD